MSASHTYPRTVIVAKFSNGVECKAYDQIACAYGWMVQPPAPQTRTTHYGFAHTPEAALDQARCRIPAGDGCDAYMVEIVPTEAV